jgi:pimeloyl-ACP methyl ester carboxylesterase
LFYTIMEILTNDDKLFDGLEILFDAGSGRTFITILDDEAYMPLAQAVTDRLATKARSLVIKSRAVTAESWRDLSQKLTALIAKLGVRQASLIGMGAGASLAQNVALNDPKTVRSMAVVDAAARPHPGRWERLIDALEARLPFGLPLRLGSGGFNVRSYLHRFRCPLLVVCTRRAGAFIREELRQLSQLAPTAWQVDLTAVAADEEAMAFTDTILSFQETPAKCPQKNTKERIG